MYRNTRYSLLALAVAGLLALAGCCFSGGEVLDMDNTDLNQPPNAILTAKAAAQSQISGEVPFAVTLDGSASTDPDGEIVDYAWDFETDGTFDQHGPDAVIDHTFEVAGTFNVTLRVTDNEGKSDTDFAVITVGDPSISPTAAEVAAVDSQNALLVHFDGTASTDLDGQIVQYDWDFDGDGTFDLIDGGPTPDHLYTSFGTKTVVLRVTDDDGNTDTTSITVTLVDPPSSVSAAVTATPDTGDAPLEVDFDASGSTSVNSTIETFDWDLDDDGTFEISDGGPTQTAQYNNLSQSQSLKGVSAPETGQNGESIYHITVRVTDSKGNVDSATVNVTVNPPVVTPTNDPPIAALNATPDKGVSPLDVVFDAGSSTDPDGTIVAIDWDLDNDGTFEILNANITQNAQYTTLGDHTATVRVTDDDGESDTASATVTVLDPPVAALTATPDNGNAPLDVQLDASGSTDSDGTIVSYDWDFESDGTFDTLDGGATLNHTYTSGGSFTATVRVTDNDGLEDTASVVLDINNPPVAALQGNITGQVPEAQIGWDASGSTDSDGTVVQYDWDMDNNGSFEISNGGPTQDGGFFQVGGDVTVCVRVTDDDGATNETCTTVHLNIPPTAVELDDVPVGSIPPGGSLDIHLDASGSSDPDGTIVQYNWDLDNDFIYEVQDGGTAQTVTVTDDGTFTFNLEVLDNDGAPGYDTAQSVITTPPTAVLTAYIFQSEGIRWDGTGSFDNNGTIVRYDFDYNNDGDYDDPEDQVDQGPFYDDFQFFGEPGDTKTVTLRVFDDDGLTDETSFTWVVPAFPQAIILRSPDPDYNAEGLDGYFGSSRLITLDGSTSFDLDGTIVQYDWDIDGDGIYETINGPAVMPDQLFELPNNESFHTFFVNLRVIDNEGYEGYATDFFELSEIPD